MTRVAIELDIDTKDQAAVNASVNRFLSDISGVGTTTVYRSDVTAPPDPDQAEADMLAGFHQGEQLVRDAGA
jgi:hypothetical protein